MANELTTTETQLTYRPLGEHKDITLTPKRVRMIATKTKSGKEPTDDDVTKFMVLCKSRELNPWVGDAFLIGYDTKDGPQFSLITSFQAVLKRAEACVSYDGMVGGVIVSTKAGLEQREGEFLREAETLVGAWARVDRRDRGTPTFISVNRATYDKKVSQWVADPAGMLVKCAKAKALRESFPSQLGGMVTKEEEGIITRRNETPKRLSTITHRPATPTVETLTHVDLDEGEAMQADGEVVTHIYDEPEA